MKRPSYRQAILWLAHNDDCEWTIVGDHEPISITAYLVADLFDVAAERVRRDLRAAYKKRWGASK